MTILSNIFDATCVIGAIFIVSMKLFDLKNKNSRVYPISFSYSIFALVIAISFLILYIGSRYASLWDKQWSKLPLIVIILTIMATRLKVVWNDLRKSKGSP
jgi:Ca2+/Na+ antiporter